MKSKTKKTAAGILAAAVVAVGMTANVGTGGIFGVTAVVASAAEEFESPVHIFPPVGRKRTWA